MLLNKILSHLPPGSRLRIYIEDFIINLANLKRLLVDVAGVKIKKRKIAELEKEHRPFTYPKPSKPEVSIVIPVFNKFDYTYTCLKSIMDNTKGINYEVIVVDNASTDKTIELPSLIKNLIVLKNESNTGFVEACNQGAEAASGTYILFLNNDTKVLPGWLAYMVAAFENDPSVGLVGAKLIYPNGRLQEAGGIVWNDTENAGWNYGRNSLPDIYEYNYLKEADYCSGACLLIRKELFTRCKGFDMRYAPAYFEDTDLAFTARSLGYKVVYQPLAEVVHFEGQTAGTDTSTGYKRYQTINHEKFYKKWRNVLEKENFRAGEDFFLARDRSRNKKHLLFIDHCVPTHDRDAGSLSTYMYLKLLVEMGYKVIFVPYNFFNPKPYTTELQQMGIEVVYGLVNFSRWLKQNGHYLHSTILSRPHVAIKYLPLVRKYSNAKVLYNMHDLHYLREMRRYEVEKKKEILKDVENWKKLENHIFSNVDTILTFSSEEGDLIREQFPQKAVVRIPLFFYDELPAEKALVPFENRKDIAFLGGFGHPPNADAVKYFVSDIFPHIIKEIPDIRFHIAGSNPPEDIKALASDNIIIRGFIKDLDELFEDIKVFVCPLRFGAGLKGKIVTSISYGIPVVCTTIGNEGLNLIDGVNGMVSDEPEDFARKVLSLYKDGVLWNKLSSNSLEFLTNNFSRGITEDRLREVLS